MFDPLIGQDEQRLELNYNRIHNMKILFLTEYSSKINFTKHLKNEIAQYVLNVTNNEINIEITANKETSIMKIANLSDSPKHNESLSRIREVSHVVYWNKKFIDKRIKFINYINIFKSADKLPNNNDMIYYAICKYDLLENTYAFIKIIVNKNIQNNDNIFNNEYLEAPIFSNIFNKINYIYEFTVCVDM
jgi:hypothetical protein